ncbi:prolyl oligopeptidase family serine peptidase [Corynebacterium cystitidis]|uniref:prolyl oligopeptidase family serine peptidase n=1 Tax=Corynebacterium cystitidis TaxID=35757 RepID=UPI00211E50F1|nr:prolyl oligopeptidase family serine peptidase [Corynebacterium cystitidis]
MRDIDPELLDDITGQPALEWVQAWSDDTLSAFDLEPLQSRILEVLDTDARIPYVTRRGEFLYNFWRDADRPRGVWRRTLIDEYLTDSPTWEELIDVDALAAAEDEDWVWKGAVVRAPQYDRALIKLSRGGADATVIREFDMASLDLASLDLASLDGSLGSSAAFYLPEAKSYVSWAGDDVLVGTDTGAGSLTESGYPREVRLWRRGQQLSDAQVIFSGQPDDVLVVGSYDPTLGFERTVVTRAIDFYNSETFIDGVRLDIPTDCEATAHRQWLFLQPRTPFSGIPAGALAVVLYDDYLSGSRDFTLLVEPDEHTSVESLAFTASQILVTTLVDVATQIHTYRLGTWECREVGLPGASSASVVATSPLDGDEYWINTSSFTQPSTLLRGSGGGSAAGKEIAEVKRAPELFDASGLETRQHWVESADGTRVPYFITGDFSSGDFHGPRPTLVGGYGGFEVSLTPGYSAVRGRAWLERGYYYVQPNLRGGGEFGPQWHSQVVKTNRHKVWEDHRATLDDLVRRGYTTPELIGIRGGSNGGLLTSGALVQYPDALGAAVIQVPLTDMLRYHTLSAGASWMAEYGNPDDPTERAAIEKWSPLHNIPQHNIPGGTNSPLPPALVTTSTRDDRVHPAHARRFALALHQAGQPVDYYENTVGGHAGAADNTQTARVEALIYSWLDRQLGQKVR